MENVKKLILEEAENITDYIIKKKKHELDSVKVIDKWIADFGNKSLSDYRIDIHAHIPHLLTKKEYVIISTDPLIVKKF